MHILGSGLLKYPLSLQVEEQFTTIDIVQHKVQLRASLEGVVEANEEGMLDVLQQNITFSHDVLDLISLDNGLLLQDLDGIALPCLLVLA